MIIRNIEKDDFNRGYLELLFELSNFKSTITQEEFNDYIENKKCIIKVVEIENKIIAAGSLFIMSKLHCNPFGQIEDVVVKKEYRKSGLGKQIVEILTETGKNLGCYKIVLNSLEHNIEFYNKCGFLQSGIQFKK